MGVNAALFPVNRLPLGHLLIHAVFSVFKFRFSLRMMFKFSFLSGARPWLALLVGLLLLLSAAQPLCAQAPTWQDAVGPGAGQGWSTAVDAAGNTYVTGSFYNTATFGAITLTSAGYDLFVAKRSPAGVWQWATGAGGSSYDTSTGVAVDGSGNVVVTGYFRSPTITFGTTTLTNANAGEYDLFVAKLTPTGAWQWATGAGGSGWDSGSGVAVDGSGNVVVTGYFDSPTITFGVTTLTNAGSFDLFVAKLTPTGAWQWATSAGGSRTDWSTGVAVDGSGSVVVTGFFFSSTITFGATTLTNASAGYSDLFVAKLTPTGTWQWATGAGGIYDDFSYGVAVDGSGSVVVTGPFYSSTLSFGATTLANAGFSNLFVAKLTPTGAWQWATGAGGTSPSSTSSYDWSRGVAVDGSGSVVVTGYFSSSTLTFGATTLTNAGNEDLFVAKLTPTGIWQWATGAGSSDSDYSIDVAVDGSGSVVVTGYFTSPTLTFGATTLTNPTPNPGPFDYAFFLARLSTVTGLPEDPTQPAFTLAPNPARTTVQVMGAVGTTATLLDAVGRVVGTAAISPTGAATLDVRALPAGLYVLRAGAATRRLVVE